MLLFFAIDFCIVIIYYLKSFTFILKQIEIHKCLNIKLFYRDIHIKEYPFILVEDAIASNPFIQHLLQQDEVIIEA